MRLIRDLVEDWAMPIMASTENGWFPIEGRPEAIMRLIVVLKEEGYDRDGVQAARGLVAEYCVNKKSKKRQAWRGIVNREFDRAVWAVFGETLRDVSLVDTAEKIEAGKRFLEASKAEARDRIAAESEARQEAEAEIIATRYRQHIPDEELLKQIRATFKFGPGDDEDIL